MTMPVISDWSYSGDPSSSTLDEVRFYVQDTDRNVRLLSDVEVNFVILKWIGTQDPDSLVWNGPYDAPLMAAHGCALRIAAKFAGVATVDADGVEVDLSGLQARYTALAAALKLEYEFLAEPDADVDYANLLAGTTIDMSIAPLDFGIGMHDNMEAGRQNYGGQYGASEWDAPSTDGNFEHL